MSFKAIGSLAVRLVTRNTDEEELGLGVDVVGDDVHLNVPGENISIRLDAVNARRLYDFLGQAVPLALKDTP